MKKVIISLSVLVCFVFAINAQGVKISATTGSPDNSSMLEVESSSKGFLPPRMTTSQRDAILNPAQGLVIFNTTTNCLNMYAGSSWRQSCFDCTFTAPALASNSPLCAGGTLNLSASSIAGATYSWTGPAGFTSSLQNPTISSVTAAHTGTYTLTTTVNGCSLTSSLLVTVNAAPNAAFAYAPTSSFVNGTTTFTPAVSGLSYSWTIPNANPSATSATAPTITWTTNGTSNVILVVTDGNGCSASTTQSINVQCQPLPLGQNVTYNYTGNVQTWTVPSCVTEITVDVYGAQGGNGYRPGNQGSGGLGGRVTGKLAVTPGSVLNLYVGGQGAGGQQGTGGWNGGGNGNQYSSNEAGGGGGGSSDVRIGGTNYSNRVVVAGGGGGGSNTTGANGGTGGYPNGSNGISNTFGSGGTQSAGGTGGAANSNGGAGQAGQLGVGGNSGGGQACGGGGGGGYYGGGGGGGCNSGGGGGGSSYIGSLTNATTFNGVQSGNGLIVISW